MTTYPRGRGSRKVYRAPWLKNPPDKIEVREYLIEMARLLVPEVGTILTLPGQTAHCMQAFRKAFPDADILGVERDALIFDALKVWWEETGPSGTSIRHITVEKWIEQNDKSFDLAFLDFTSYPQPSLLAATGRFLDRNLSRPGVCGITFSVHPQVNIRVREPTAEFYAERTGVAAPTPEGVATVLPSFVERPIRVLKAVRTAREMIFIAVASQDGIR